MVKISSSISSINKILLTSTNSGAGKTTITCGILKALSNLNLNVSSFKCGPDYIDPLFHEHILGNKSTNLDLFFMNDNLLKYTFHKYANNHDIAVIEGVMGFYDGIAGTTTTASAYDVSKTLNCNCVLIVDAKGASYSIIATILGFLLLEKNNIRGVILNKCSKHLYELLAPLISEKCGIIPLGFLPNDPDFSIESRHLGLVTANEIESLNEKIEKIAQSVKENINLELLITISKHEATKKPENSIFTTQMLNKNKKLFNIKPKDNEETIISVAYDKAFCFYYNETFDLFKQLGYTIKFFSPLKDSKIPDNTDILYIGGGYPELYLDILEQNTPMKESIKQAINSKTPTLAECGGFMFLGNKIQDKEMVGVIDADFHNTKKLSRFGYIDITCENDNILFNKTETIKAHEFHYYDSNNNGTSFKATKPITNRTWQATHITDNLIAGFPHLYLPSYFYE